MESFLDRAFELLASVADDYEVVFVNDGSNDRTEEILARYTKSEPRLRVINNERNLNVGISCRRAVAAAEKEYLFWQTVDWSYDLQNLPIFLRLLDHFDVVQGIRPTPIRLMSFIPVVRSIYRVRRRSDSFYKALISLGNYYLLRVLYGVPFHDFQNVTIYPTHMAQSTRPRGKSSFINPEFLINTYMDGATFIEVPIPFIPRTMGIAKGTRFSSIMNSVIDIVGNWLVWGWKLRFRNGLAELGEIQRVSDPISLEDDILEIVLPLLKEFR